MGEHFLFLVENVDNFILFCQCTDKFDFGCQRPPKYQATFLKSMLTEYILQGVVVNLFFRNGWMMFVVKSFLYPTVVFYDKTT